MEEHQAIYGSLDSLQTDNYYRSRDEDDMWILQLLEEPQDESNLNYLLSGDLPSSSLVDTHAAHQLLEGPQDEANVNDLLPGGLPSSLFLVDTDVAHQLLERPQDEATNLNNLLSAAGGDLPSSPLVDTNATDHQTECGKSGRRGTPKRTGTRKRRTSPWDPTFFERRVDTGYTSRKNNSRWTAKEVERLVQGISKFGVGPWAYLKQNFFKTSIRTAVNLKDKWRNLLKAYQGKLQRTTQVHLDPSLVEQIRKLAAKQS